MTGSEHLMAGLIGRMSAAGFSGTGFATRPVGAGERGALLAAARVAPSADNLQTWRFVVVETPETRRALADAVPAALHEAVATAPLVIVAAGVKAIVTRVKREQPFVMVDVPIAVTHILLEAAEIGLACAWTLDTAETLVRKAVALPDDVRVIALLALGWPA